VGLKLLAKNYFCALFQALTDRTPVAIYPLKMKKSLAQSVIESETFVAAVDDYL
jgi:hypothetical protein